MGARTAEHYEMHARLPCSAATIKLVVRDVLDKLALAARSLTAKTTKFTNMVDKIVSFRHAFEDNLENALPS